MKKTLTTKAKMKQPDELAPEYRFDTGGQNRTDSLSGHGRNHCNSSGADVAQVFETGDRGECRAPGFDADNATEPGLFAPMNCIFAVCV